LQNLNDNTNTSNKYINTIQLSDNIAFEQLQFACKPKLLAMLNKMLSFSESQEIIQDAMLKVFLLAKQNPSSSPFATKLQQLEPLLFTIAKNLAISKTRHHIVRENYLREQSRSINEQTFDSLETTVTKQKEQELLHNAIEHLPLLCKKIFIERKLQGKSHDEIAKQFNISKKTVESHITKGLKRCRQYIFEKQNKPLLSQSAKPNLGKKSA
jgi:RNA polymerase sigma-70 factor (ECF subfamily)